MKRPDWILLAGFLTLIALFFFGCAGFADFLAATESGGRELAPALPHVPGAAAGSPTDWVAIGSYVANAVLAAWGTWERRQRKKGT